MVFDLLTDILIVFTIALVVGMIFNRIKVPPLVAYILTGVIVGPYGLSIIQGQEQVKNLAEIGIILLLFTIGLEFSFKDLLEDPSYCNRWRRTPGWSLFCILLWPCPMAGASSRRSYPDGFSLLAVQYSHCAENPAR